MKAEFCLKIGGENILECPYCGRELDYTDYYGTGRPENFYGTAANGIHYPSTYHKLGDIYQCGNASGFETKESAMVYIKATTEEELQKYIIDNGLENWAYVVCNSETFNGNFYTDNNDNLHEGYPC